MTQAEREYLEVREPERLRALESGSRAAREWFEASQAAINDALRYGNGPTQQELEERRRFERENEGAAGW